LNTKQVKLWNFKKYSKTFLKMKKYFTQHLANISSLKEKEKQTEDLRVR